MTFSRWMSVVMMVPLLASSLRAATWTADNGNGTFTNPLFYDEFSDPDMIRVGDDYYLTGTTMHAMPGLPVLHSKDLVNWTFLTYASAGLDFGPQYRLEDGEWIYGKGIWAPSFRYHDGTFYIFSNVNGRKTQIYTATQPAGPWTHREMKQSFHDLSVLFDDDGKIYVVWGNTEIHIAQLNGTLDDVVPGSEQILIQKSAGMCEGSHFYKIGGEYYITNSWYRGRMRMPCARSDKPLGPYEVNPEISADEDFGLAEGNRLANEKLGFPFTLRPMDPRRVGVNSMHQGGVIETQTGEWWGFSMMDYNSVGRLLCLSPVTWKDGWPYFGLPGNLERTPRTWVKPNTGHASSATAPYQRSDDFSDTKLAPVWQWNHMPVNAKWSLTERPGYLRLHAMPAADFWTARNTLTQRAIGPVSVPTTELDASGLADGDVAGLALLNYPYAWIGVKREGGKLAVTHLDQNTGKTETADFAGTRIWLRAECDFLHEKATFSYSADGKAFTALGEPFSMIFQGRTFQGVRYSLFNFNAAQVDGGFADFDGITIDEPNPKGLMRPIPFGQNVTLTGVEGNLSLVAIDGHVTVTSTPQGSTSAFTVVDRGLGRVAFRNNGSCLSVDEKGGVRLKTGEPSDGETFQWTETPYGDLVLLSIRSQRLVNINPNTHAVTATSPGPRPDRRDGTWLRFDRATPGK